MEQAALPPSELRLEELLRPGASAASARFCARLRRDSYARVSLPPDASALLLRAQAECPTESSRAQSPDPSAAQLGPSHARLCQTRPGCGWPSETDSHPTWIVRPQAECSAWFAQPDAAKLAQAGELAPREGRYVGYSRNVGRRELLELRSDDDGVRPRAVGGAAPAPCSADTYAPAPPWGTYQGYAGVITRGHLRGVRTRRRARASCVPYAYRPPACPAYRAPPPPPPQALCALLEALEGWAQAPDPGPLPSHSLSPSPGP